MLEFYFEAPEELPSRKKGQSYKRYNREINNFFYNYKKHYIWKGRIGRNFWINFREDFFNDPNYRYIIKYLYRKGENLSSLRLYPFPKEREKELKRKISRKQMLSNYPPREPFLRLRDPFFIDKRIKEDPRVKRYKKSR